MLNVFMKEKRKMISGKLYNPMAENLPTERLNVKKLCQKYNNLSSDDMLKRTSTMSKILRKTGQNFLIEQPFWCDYGYNIYVGENFYMNHNCIILDGAKVEFGDNVFIAPNCGFYKRKKECTDTL